MLDFYVALELATLWLLNGDDCVSHSVMSATASLTLFFWRRQGYANTTSPCNELVSSFLHFLGGFWSSLIIYTAQGASPLAAVQTGRAWPAPTRV